MGGAKVVSVKENVDESPAGQLLHAFMALIAEFYRRNLATEALKGMTQKAKLGGTPGRAPMGYLNVRRTLEGREVRTVAVDPERAPMERWAFEVYFDRRMDPQAAQRGAPREGLEGAAAGQEGARPDPALPRGPHALQPLLLGLRRLR
jgi:hypothetical protein